MRIHSYFRLILYISLILIFNISSVFSQKVTKDYITSNQYKVDILKYDLFINLEIEKKSLIAEISITGVIIDETLTSIDLNFYNNLYINELKLNNVNQDFIHKGSLLSVKIDETVTDTFYLKIRYSGTPKSFGPYGFVFGEVNDRSLVYTLNQPNYAAAWLPCNDIPSDKAMLDIRIRNTKENISVSNGKLISVEDDGIYKIYHWQTFYPISTYLISIYSAPYEYFGEEIILNNDTLSIEYYVMPEHLENAKKDFSVHNDMIKFFSDTFGEYPFIKERYGVAEFLWNFGAMEHQTITGIGYNFVSGNDFFSDIYSHELAHQWWGNAVGLKSWDEIWLNEGFATYSEALYNEYKYGKEALRSFMLSKYNDDFYGKLYAPVDLFSSTVYDKGAWVLHMLRFELGDSTFSEILRTYFNKFKYSSASTNDFKDVCESVSQKNLTNFFNQWIFEGEDQIEVEYFYSISELSDNFVLSVNLNQVQPGYYEFHFPLEFKIVYEDGSEEIVKSYIENRIDKLEFEFLKKPVEIIPDPFNWLLASFKNL